MFHRKITIFLHKNTFKSLFYDAFSDFSIIFAQKRSLLTSPFGQQGVWSGHFGTFGGQLDWSIKTVFPVISDHFHPLSAH